MPKKDSSTKAPWVDPDDAPAWTAETFARAAIIKGGDVVRPASGTLTRRGRPKLDDPKRRVTLRVDPDVLEAFKADGAGWQSRMNSALRKAAKL